MATQHLINIAVVAVLAWAGLRLKDGSARPMESADATGGANVKEFGGESTSAELPRCNPSALLRKCSENAACTSFLKEIGAAGRSLAEVRTALDRAQMAGQPEGRQSTDAVAYRCAGVQVGLFILLFWLFFIFFSLFRFPSPLSLNIALRISNQH